MSNEQREFIVKKIKKYNDEIDEHEKQSSLNAVALAITVSTALIFVSNMTNSVELLERLGDGTFISVSIGVAVYNAKKFNRIYCFNDDNEYVVVSKINYQNKIYYYLIDINNNENIKFCSEKENNTLVEIFDETLNQTLLLLFVNETKKTYF